VAPNLLAQWDWISPTLCEALMTFSRTALPLLLAASVTLVGCNNPFGASSTSSNNGSGSSTSTTVAGSAMAGPVSGTIRVLDGGTQVASGTINNGVFSLDIPNSALANELTLEVTGTYTDEISGNLVTLTSANPLGLVLDAGHVSAGVTMTGLAVTPESTVHYQLIQQGKTMAEADAIFSGVFGAPLNHHALLFDPTQTEPAAVAALAAADQQLSRAASFQLGAYSQLAANLGLTSNAIADLPAALATDLLDGTLDGMNGLTPVVAGTATLPTTMWSSYVGAQAQFSGGSAAGNANNLPPPMDGSVSSRVVTVGLNQVAVGSLTLSTILPMTNIPFTGKTTQRIALSDPNTGAALTSGYTVTVAPVMHMPTMTHACPMGAVVPDATVVGAFDVDLYYLMASGAGMGLWDVAVTVSDGSNSAVAHFNPTVAMMGMPMSSVAVVKPKDSINRTTSYQVWLDGYDAVAGTVDLFITTPAMMMMSFPGVTGAVITPPSGAIVVELGGGHYRLSGLALNAGSAYPLAVDVAVGGSPLRNLGATAAADTIPNLIFTP